MKKLILSITLIFNCSLLAETKLTPCEFEQKDSCEKGSYCVFIKDPDQAYCKKSYDKKIPVLAAPFIATQPSTCYKAEGRRANSSHAWWNSRFALDIHTESGVVGLIRAGLSGKAKVFGGCKPNQPKCNASFGNQIKIFSDNGIMLYYTHLSEILISNDDEIQVGQVIGKEGVTGNVGGSGKFKHLHLSVHYDWRRFDDKFHSNPWPGLNSIPFKIKMCKEDQLEKCIPVERDIRDLACTKFDAGVPPIRGL